MIFLTQSGPSSSPRAPGKGTGWKPRGVGAFPHHCNEDWATSPSNVGGQGAALPASYFSCVDWEDDSAACLAGDRAGTPDATPACVLPDGELGKGHLVSASCGPEAGTTRVNASFIQADKSRC